MHLINQPIHVFSCSNLAMKGNNWTNRVLYHDTAAKIITEFTPHPPVFHCSNLEFQIVSFLEYSPNVNFSWRREQCECQLIWPHHMSISSCLMSTFLVVKTSFMHLSITFSNQRFSNCSPTVDAGFVKLTFAIFNIVYACFILLIFFFWYYASLIVMYLITVVILSW
jgi:hypothetical protein